MLNDSEIKIITHACSISDHPVSKLPMQIRINYLQGLKAILPMSEPFMNALYKAWETSILGEEQSISYDSNNQKEKVKTAIKLYRIGRHCFRLAYSFFFDYFYLASLCNKSYLVYAKYESLIGYCNLFTKKALQRVYDYFKNGTPYDKIPAQLVKHRDVNLKFESLPLKKVLVVANVSAGKSTLINTLVGRKLNKTATDACTKETCYIFGKPQEDGLIIKQRKTGNLIYEDNVNKCASDEGEAIGLFMTSDLLKGKKICFIDTPGYNDERNLERRKITENAIKGNDYDAVMYVANAAYMGRVDEQHLLETIIHNTKKPIIFVMNGLDFYDPEDDSIANSIENYRQDIIRAGVSKPTIIPISAYFAFLLRMNDKGLLAGESKLMRKLEKFKEWFADDYYNLPAYVNYSIKKSNEMIYRTGLPYLEETLLRI